MAKGRSGAVQCAATGVVGFDEAARGGLPTGRVTVVLGGPGAGKTLFASQFLATGVLRSQEPGLFVAFEESSGQTAANTASFEWGLGKLKGKGLHFIDAQLGDTVVQGGEFDLIGLLAVVEAKAKAMRAKRVVFDGLDVLLAHLGDGALVRREVFRLRAWAQGTGLTVVMTAKADRAGGPAKDYEFLEFLADCVVNLQHRLIGGAAHRFLRITKYRGVAHSAAELPFSIGESGIEVAAGSSAELRHAVSNERLTSGLDRLDDMLAGGYYRGSSTLITGAPGTAKTTLAAAFAAAACRRKEPTLFVSFDEAPEQIVRNVASVGIQLGPYLREGRLKMCSLRSRAISPEEHVARIRALLAEHRIQNLIVDPLSALLQGGAEGLAEGAATQLLDLTKRLGVTSVSTSLLGNKAPLSEETPIGISTIADTWMHLSYVGHGGERNRALTIIKSRGTAHSNQVRELLLASSGLSLPEPYLAGGEVLMGTLRWERENERRRELELAERDADLREAEATLALAETAARAKSVLAEQTVREATLSQLKAQRSLDVSRDDAQVEVLRQRRGGVARLARTKRAKAR
jgi:circadian clock protein KaiC